MQLGPEEVVAFGGYLERGESLAMILLSFDCSMDWGPARGQSHTSYLKEFSR